MTRSPCTAAPTPPPDGLPGLVALVVAFGACVAAIPPSPSAAGPCPSAIVHLEHVGGVPFPVDAPVYDSTFVVWPETPQIGTAHVAFDRTQGRISLSAQSGTRLRASVRIVERLDVTGVPAGTPVAATIEYRLEGWSEQDCGGSGCGLEFAGTLAVGAESMSADANHQGPGTRRRLPLDATLSLPVTFVAGSPIQAEFALVFGCGAGAGGANVDGTGTYRVSGLAAGVRAIACAGADVTPVRWATWGRLKSLYR